MSEAKTENDLQREFISAQEDLIPLTAIRLCEAKNGKDIPSANWQVHIDSCWWCKSYIKQRRKNQEYLISEVRPAVAGEWDESC